jgi:hypothetical protein
MRSVSSCSESSTARKLSPGTQKTRSTPCVSSASTISRAPVVVSEEEAAEAFD